MKNSINLNYLLTRIRHTPQCSYNPINQKIIKTYTKHTAIDKKNTKIRAEFCNMVSREGDIKVWKDGDLVCAILRVYSSNWGYLNGYVGIPNSHKILKRSPHPSFYDLEAHGGVTWVGNLSYVDRRNKFTWVGFDTAHYLDSVPGYSTHSDGRYSGHWGGTYRDMEYVSTEVVKLAEQIKRLL